MLALRLLVIEYFCAEFYHDRNIRQTDFPYYFIVHLSLLLIYRYQILFYVLFET